jgi:hypothetical protein
MQSTRRFISSLQRTSHTNSNYPIATLQLETRSDQAERPRSSEPLLLALGLCVDPSAFVPLRLDSMGKIFK